MNERLSFAPRIPVFDGQVQVGRRHDRPVSDTTAADLLARMDRWGIQRALVHHTLALQYDGPSGNAELMEWIGDSPRLIPQWCAHLSLDALDAFAAGAEAAGVRAVRAAPRLGRYPFAAWVVDEWLGWLRDTARGLWISLTEVEPDPFHEVIHRHPDLKVVLSDAHYTHHAIIGPLLRALPNLTLELSRYDVAGGVRRLIDRFGAHRFIFGSAYPDLAPEAYLYYLHHAGLDDDALRAICAENLERLLA